MSKIDIIALAKEAGATIFYEISTNPTNNIGKISFTKQQLKKLSKLHEAEIRKEYEVKLENASSIAIRQDDEIANLTEQNTKLMEALERSKRFVRIFDPTLTAVNWGDREHMDALQWLRDYAALTPQEVKE